MGARAMAVRLLLSILVVLALPGSALGAPSLTRSGTQLTYSGDSAADALTVSPDGANTVLTPNGANEVSWGTMPTNCTQDGATFVVTCAFDVTRLTFNGSAGNDSLTNTEAFASGLIFNGGTNDDTLNNSGSSAVATVNGNDGNDSLTGGSSADTINGNAGDDSLDGRGAIDTLNGNDGDDSVAGENGNDIIKGGTGSDSLRGDAGNDDIDGEEGADELFGLAGIDSLDGGTGRDGLTGGTEADDLVGGEGFDIARYSDRSVAQPVTVDLDDVADDGAPGEADNAHKDVEDIGGGAGNDKLTGDEDDNVIDGGPGADELEGGGGVDTAIGGDGNDVMRFRDGLRESVDCGSGTGDTVVGDEIDETLDCETQDLSAELTSDVDGDGVAAPTDCNDRNSAIRPNATDTPDNGIDENCDGADTIDLDRDKDGSARPGDCDDTNATVRPTAAEVFGNTVDEDCNGVADPFPSITATVLSGFSVIGSRTTVTTLSARNVPAGVRIEVRCSGKGCPKRYTRNITKRTSSVSLLKAVRRALRAGSTLEIRMTRSGYIGRVVRYPIKRGKLPVSSTLCLQPGATRATEC